VYEREFFERPPDEVARDLVGSVIVVRTGDDVVRARLLETEAYDGANDPASHAFRGPTPRAAVMFGPGGVLYVYRSYGVHWCMNVVTRGEGTASAVLLRAAQILDETTSAGPHCGALLRGPGNLTRGLGITGVDNGVDCCSGAGARVRFEAFAGDDDELEVACSPRIGLTKARERMSRYFVKGHPGVSGPRRDAEGGAGP